MNQLLAQVIQIDSLEHLNIVELALGSDKLTMMSLELSDTIVVGKKVKLTIKPSHITLAKELSGVLSHSNILPAKVHSIEEGQLLSVVEVVLHSFHLEAIITTKILKKMALLEGEGIEILIKASDLSIVEVLDD